MMNIPRFLACLAALLSLSPAFAKEVKDTLYSTNGDRVILNYNMSMDGGQVTVKFNSILKKLGQRTQDKYKKLDEIAAFLKLNPQAKVTVTGYADKGTGNAQINKRLGENRAKVVADRLVKQYRVDRSQIIVDSKGDTEQPFAENDKNRVSICIAE